MFDGKGGDGHSFAFGGRSCVFDGARYRAIVYPGGSTKPYYGQAGVRLSAFTRASSDAEPPRCRSISTAAACGSQYTAEPAPERSEPPFCRCPPACSTSVMFPKIGPASGLAM